MYLANLFSDVLLDVPYFGKRFKVSRINLVLEEINRIKNRFNKPMIRFDDNINDLYDCLKGLDLTIEEDISWFLDIDITCYTKTSTEAARYLIRHSENGFPREEHFFKELSAGSLTTGFIDWYSNQETVQSFIDMFFYVIDVYCTENPRYADSSKLDEQDDAGNSKIFTNHRTREINASLMEFFNTNTFRLMLDDFLSVVEVALVTQLRRLHGYTI